jgi:hypothetical protein
MKFTLMILIFVSNLIAGVDTVYTDGHIYTGKVIQATESEVFIFNSTSLKQTIQKNSIKRFVLNGGEVIVGLGVPSVRYESYLMDLSPYQTDNSVTDIEGMLNTADSLELKKQYYPSMYNPRKTSPEERSADALEDIAFLLKVQFGLGILLILVSLSAF